MIYLKTYFYREFEFEYILANLKETFNYIDKFIVTEFNCHHTGRKRNFLNENVLDTIPSELKSKIDYHKCDILKYTVETDNEDLIHQKNEPVMRSYFTKLYNFKDDDIIISVDADEILYNEKMDYLLEMTKQHGIVQCKMRQFFFKENYLWKNKVWTSPISTLYKNINPKFPNNWRDVGRSINEFVGAHMSWCMSPEDMIFKLHTYSHPRFRKYADLNVLQKAIENKEYIFDSKTNFEIEELKNNSELIPMSMRK